MKFILACVLALMVFGCDKEIQVKEAVKQAEIITEAVQEVVQNKLCANPKYKIGDVLHTVLGNNQIQIFAVESELVPDNDSCIYKVILLTVDGDVRYDITLWEFEMKR